MRLVTQTSNPPESTPLLAKICLIGLLIIFGGVVVHAPISVYLGSVLVDAAIYIKAWKELLMLVVGLILVVLISRRRLWTIYKQPIFYGIATFATLVILLVPYLFNNWTATLAGLIINLRYFVFFGLVFGFLKLYPQYRKLFIKVFFAGAILVIGFALLQLTVLPVDILAHIGYGPSTIMPYMTVDSNQAYVRINSTLRGPNPLGAYTIIVLTTSVGALLALRNRLSRWQKSGLILLATGAVVTLLASYSRAAALGAIIALVVVVLLVLTKKWLGWLGLAVALVLVSLSGVVFILKDTQLVSQVILHQDPLEGNNLNSNDGHATSLTEGAKRLLQQPLGGGIGSTGSASLLTDAPLIIENQYLFTAHETGWLGLGLFLGVHFLVIRGLWRRRHDWLALAVFASGIGLLVVGVVLPVWTDDTVALVWWGLAAIGLATMGLAAKGPASQSLTPKGAATQDPATKSPASGPIIKQTTEWPRSK